MHLLSIITRNFNFEHTKLEVDQISVLVLALKLTANTVSMWSKMTKLVIDRPVYKTVQYSL